MRGSAFWLPTSSAPKVVMRAAARTLPTPKSRSMSRRVRSGRSSCSSWLMASGMARSQLASRASWIPHAPATSPAGGDAVNALDRSAAARTYTPDPGVGTTAGSTSRSVAAAPVPDQMEASVPRPAASSAAAVVATSPPASRPGWTRGVTNSSTVGHQTAVPRPRPPAAAAGVPGAKSPRTTGLRPSVARLDSPPEPTRAAPRQPRGEGRRQDFQNAGDKAQSKR